MIDPWLRYVVLVKIKNKHFLLIYTSLFIKSLGGLNGDGRESILFPDTEMWQIELLLEDCLSPSLTHVLHSCCSS